MGAMTSLSSRKPPTESISQPCHLLFLHGMAGFSYIDGMGNVDSNQGTKVEGGGRAGAPDFDPMFVVMSEGDR